MATVPELFRLLLITLVAALAHGFVLPDFCFHYSSPGLGLDTEEFPGIQTINA